MTSNHDNTRVKSKVSHHHQALSPISSAIWFLQRLGKICECHEYISSLKCSIYLNQIENKSELLDWNKRRTYTGEEIDAMLSVVDSDNKDKLLITVLREIGLRNSALCNLRISDIVNEFRQPKHLCRVKEKGNKYREFITSPNIKAILVSYIHEIQDIMDEPDGHDRWVFSRNERLKTKMRPSTLNNVLKRIAAKAGVTDVNVQAHTFRHTLVGNLIDAGNNVETVSKFIGHRSVDTTITYYWLKNIEDLSKEIINPFNRIYESEQEHQQEIDDEVSILNKKIDACFQIIGLMQSEITKAPTIENLRTSMNKHNTQITEILKCIAYSSSDCDSEYRNFV